MIDLSKIELYLSDREHYNLVLVFELVGFGIGILGFIIGVLSIGFWGSVAVFFVIWGNNINQLCMNKRINEKEKENEDS